MPLDSRILRSNDRVVEAANMPGRSIFSRDSGNRGVRNLMVALKMIAQFSTFLPTRLLPKPFGPNGPPGVAWGPFFGGLENVFDQIEEQSVKRFQTQATKLEVDGKAGTKTLARLDEIAFFVEKVVPNEVLLAFEISVNNSLFKKK